MCFCLLSVIIGLLFAKTNVAMKCLPVIRLGISMEGHARNIDISNNGPTQPVFNSVVSEVDTLYPPVFVALEYCDTGMATCWALFGLW